MRPDRVVQAYLDHLTVERALAANTLQSYRRDLRRYLAFLDAAGVDDLAAVTPTLVARHLAGLREGGPAQGERSAREGGPAREERSARAGGRIHEERSARAGGPGGDDDHPPLSAASAARAASAVRGLHRFALREGHTGDDPAREITPPVPPRRLPKALPVDRIEAILTACPTDGPRGLRDRALLEFLYGTGARISEAVGAAVDDLDLDTASALLHGKGGRTRLVPIGGYAIQALHAYLVRGRPALSRGRTPAVFLNARGGVLSRQSAWAILRRAAAAAGLAPEAISPHTLRHSYATHLLDGGADVRVVQELLGHASVTTTQVYTLVTVDRLREVYATTHPRAR